MDVNVRSLAAGEDLALDRQWGGGMAKAVSLTGDGQIGVAGPCIYYGYFVAGTVGAGVINVTHGTAAGSTPIIDQVASGAAVGVKNFIPVGIYCPTGCYADFASTGTVTFFYQQL